jgi:hypothetical protein
MGFQLDVFMEHIISGILTQKRPLQNGYISLKAAYKETTSGQ